MVMDQGHLYSMGDILKFFLQLKTKLLKHCIFLKPQLYIQNMTA